MAGAAHGKRFLSLLYLLGSTGLLVVSVVYARRRHGGGHAEYQSEDGS
jgi:hypothetical protein